MKEKNIDNQLEMFTGVIYTYRSILTYDWQNTEKEIIEYYNQRRTREKIFNIILSY